MEVFSPEWAIELVDRINKNEAYRRSSAGWEGSIMMVITNTGDLKPELDPAVFIDLMHGECLGARVAGIEDYDLAANILAGSAECWQKILEGRIAPIVALMSGVLKVKRGSITKLARYSSSAKELVNSAASIEADIPQRFFESK